MTDATVAPPEAKERIEQALFEIRRVIAGQDAMLERVLVCLLGQGHLLLEGVPGLAKTLTVKTTAGVLGGSFARVQFTPDLVPSDLVAAPDLRVTLTLDELRGLQRAVFDVYVDPGLVSYAVSLAAATRDPAAHSLADLAEYISFGASPRGPISLSQAARALALMRGREYVLAEDMQALAKDAPRHRLVLSYQALAEEVSADAILDRVLAAVAVPQLDLAR